MKNRAAHAIAERFDRAAASYDEAASVQAQIARHLVEKSAVRFPHTPVAILDIGCGTGLVAATAARHWPQAHITAVDAAPSMLAEAAHKIPRLKTIVGDIANIEFSSRYDLILSGMALHWMPDPCAILRRWLKGLQPRGNLFAALLIEGSFKEWRVLCASEGLNDGLWKLPSADFADDLAAGAERQTLRIEYPSAKDFLLCLKATGATLSRPGHKPFDVASMRRLLAHAPAPFAVTYDVLYIEALPEKADK